MEGESPQSGSDHASSSQRVADALGRLFADPDHNDLKTSRTRFSCKLAEATIVKEQPAEKLNDILQCLRLCFGAYQRVEQQSAHKKKDEDGGLVTVVFQRAVLSAKFCIDGGRIASVRFGLPEMGLDEAAAALEAWPGAHHLLVCEDGATVAASEVERPLAVGSAFKLAVLAALKAQVDAGDRRWRDVVELTPECRSLPGGILHAWPDGAALTLDSLATLMISISDNTAADTLLRETGRAAVEALARRNRPFLTAREFFLLKAPESGSLLEKYRRAGEDEARKRKFLMEKVDAAELPDPAAFDDWVDPMALDVEWFFSARELRNLMDRVRELPLMSVNSTPVVDSREWARVAYKGGSEPGVLNMTFFLESHAGKQFHVVLTFNDERAPLNQLAVIALVSIIIENLKLRSGERKKSARRPAPRRLTLGFWGFGI